MTYDELHTELTWLPEVSRVIPKDYSRVVVGGMGGSALPAYAARFLEPTLQFAVHHDYDLPEDASDDALFVAISYSGNTAETLSFARMAQERGHQLCIVTSGGALAAFAKEHEVPHVLVPGGIQPRNALFYQLRALLALTNNSAFLGALAGVSFDKALVEKEGTLLAGALAGALPIFYASRKNKFLAYLGKIMCNETGKMPAYANVFPEMNHNEMQSFDTAAPPEVAALARLVLLHDATDDARITERMDVFADLMRERGRTVIEVAIEGGSRVEKLVRSWFVLETAAFTLATARGADPDNVPLVEEFKKRL